MSQEAIEVALKNEIKESENLLWHIYHRSPIPKEIAEKIYLITILVLCLGVLILLFFDSHGVLGVLACLLIGVSTVTIVATTYLMYFHLETIHALTDKRGILLKRLIRNGRISPLSMTYEEMYDYEIMSLRDVSFFCFDKNNPARGCGKKRTIVVPATDIDIVKQIIDDRKEALLPGNRKTFPDRIPHKRRNPAL